ncbi:MAG TPA: Cu(I)-responsive transcriptional regulator [Alphaproteobacteria bacterium]|jgi:MerR family copper efflux transcriptional regulator|nr:Cu(I)-responsive transcriptional regulator [Alphaproteobacteria bacterium]
MNIGEIAARSGMPPKTIRYYESVGLIPEARRTGSGYRTYDDRDLRILRFIHRARDLGFSVKDVGELLALWRDPHRSSAEVKGLARAHVADIDRKIAELRGMRRAVTDLMERCHGDERPDCPILDDLAGD